MSVLDGIIAAYDRGAAAFTARYEAVSAGALWGRLQNLLPSGAGRLALDVGAGSGRDAAWLVGLGFEVVAAEPAAGMRAEGRRLHPELRWIDDRLPALTAVHRLGLSYDLVLLSAVWMHLPPGERPRAFRKLATLLKPGGVLILTLRDGPEEPERAMYPTSVGEIEALAREHGLAVLRALDEPDRLGRAGVAWTSVVLRLPDDGSLGLPLIRGIVLNDEKSSTYKLGLLRAVAKIADLAPSLAVAAPDGGDRVLVPMGCVALHWLRAYLPLVAAGLPQAPGNSGPDGLRFAGPGFRALLALGITAGDLRLGMRFAGPRADALVASLGEVRRTILAMPARHTTYPNAGGPVFEGVGRPARVTGPVTLTPETLTAWGHLSVPGPLWRTLLRLGAWVEPVLVAEWARLIRGYGVRMSRAYEPGAVETCLVWQEPARDTGLARLVAGRLAEAGTPPVCVWSGTPLRLDALDIDHALPWSAWPCGDLWNLVPSSRRVNQHEKRERLPSATALARAREPILAWWQTSWDADPGLAERFWAEARAALPIGADASFDAAFAGLEWRRLRVSQDQQAPEWVGVRGQAPWPDEAAIG
ncbi:methyltransferase domain-containing protein [Methylobacterium currus]|uniref:methyltransferase domain-containing protein n=1 Tax=Methylobacterium currus TaxID=2051553 RepID=UPI001E468E37|nr:methyltransferase domain-containing protein [Methylobacterium currus]UHC17813.1 methyltransferase domain-containing protein [Methylobacterium currus]